MSVTTGVKNYMQSPLHKLTEGIFRSTKTEKKKNREQKHQNFPGGYCKELLLIVVTTSILDEVFKFFPSILILYVLSQPLCPAERACMYVGNIDLFTSGCDWSLRADHLRSFLSLPQDTVEIFSFFSLSCCDLYIY